MLEKLRRFMAGRYGYDQLTRFLFIVSIVFWLLSGIFRFTPFRRVYLVFWVLNTAIYVFAFYRMFSRNIERRAYENDRYLQLKSRIYPKWHDFSKLHFDKEYLYKKCPHCSTRLRLRRIRGRHKTKCPKCGTKFTVRVFWGDK
ncbi:MAG: hypothetical protein IK104_03825 [Clostridia bacterium]|nr:hypothetical protein [Clostridia bacterium]